MKPGIHPEYREVVFVDISNDFSFVTRSTAQTKETITWKDSKEYPVYKLETSAESLRSVSPRLVPLIAHDCASFGGMIVASGLCFLGVAPWEFRWGERWVWWTLLLAGIPG